MTAERPLDADDLAEFCSSHGVPGRLHRLEVPTPTVPAAAEAVGTVPGRIVKSLVFLVLGEPLLVIAAGEGRVSYPRLARELGVSRKRLRFASPDEALAITGFRVGAMPPFGHLADLPTLADTASLPAEGVVFCGGGSVSALWEMDVGDLLEVTGARRAVLSGEAAAER